MFMRVLQKLKAARDARYVAPTPTAGLIFKSEELALNLPQATQRGDDLGRFMRKNGVTDQEIKDLNLNNLFKQERVTQDQLLDHIKLNKFRLSNEQMSGEEGNVSELVERELSLYETFGFQGETEQEFLERAAKEQYIEYDILSYKEGDVIDLIPNYADEADRVAAIADIDAFKDGSKTFDNLDPDVQEALLTVGKKEALQNYENSKVKEITLSVDDEDVPGYKLIGNDDTGFHLSGLAEDNDSIEAAGTSELRIGLSERERYMRHNQVNDFMDEEKARDFLLEQARINNRLFEDGIELPGADYRTDLSAPNYREFVVSGYGEFEPYDGHHYSSFDQDGYLAHYRLSDMEGEDGEKILYIEESQSDRAQQGRKRGFIDPEKQRQGEAAMDNIFNDVKDAFAGQNGGFSTRIEPLTFVPSYSRELQAAIARVVNQPSTANDYRSLQFALNSYKNQIKRGQDSLALEFLDGPDFVDSLSDDAVREFVKTRVDNREMSELGDSMPIEYAQEVVRAYVQNNIDTFLANDFADLKRLTPQLSRKFDEFSAQAKNEIDNYLFDTTNIPPGALDRLETTLQSNRNYNLILEQSDAIPPAPLMQRSEDWNNLVAKQILMEADRGGYDKVVFTPPGEQIARYPGQPPKAFEQQYGVNVPSALARASGQEIETVKIPGLRGPNEDSPGIDMRKRNRDGLTASDKIRRDNYVYANPATVAGAAGLTAAATTGSQQSPRSGRTPAEPGAAKEFGAGILSAGMDYVDSLRPTVPYDPYGALEGLPIYNDIQTRLQTEQALPREQQGTSIYSNDALRGVLEEEYIEDREKADQLRASGNFAGNAALLFMPLP